MKKYFLVTLFFAPVLFVGALGLYHSRSTSDNWLIPGSDGYRLLDPSLSVTYNPYAPEGGNDGAVWQGKGWNSWLWAGAQAKWGPLSITAEPQAWFAQNLEFSTLYSTASDGLGDYWWGLDWLQRDGRNALLKADWGNSEVRLSSGPWSLGAGTEALWLGSGFRNSVLLSNNAGGFPHVDLGTLVPWKTDWGIFEGKMLWGVLNNSTGAYDRFFHGLVLSYALPFFPNLTIGAGRLFYSPIGTVTWWKAFESVDDSLLKAYRGKLNGSQGEDDIDQLAALYFDWVFPVVGFHLYAEIARNDHSGDFKDLMAQPDHTIGYVFGLDQTIELGFDWALFYRYEQADLGRNIGTTIRGTTSWYRHSVDVSGYTLGGQLLGASIGPGSNSQTLELGGVYQSIRLSAVLERVAKDVDYFLQVVASQPLEVGALDYADIKYSYALKCSIPTGPWEWLVQAGVSNEFDRNFVRGQDSGIALATSITYHWGQ